GDSIALDPHKGLFLPYGTGALLVRDAGALRRAHGVMADYLPEMQESTAPDSVEALSPELSDFHLLSPELSRAWRGLRVWLPIEMHGIEPFRTNLDEKLDLALWATEELKKIRDIEILAEPQLSIVAFRLVRPGLDLKGLNALNRGLMDRVNRRKRIYVSGTMLGDIFAIRFCVLSFRTHFERMQNGLEDLRAAVQEC
ncbi:MAG TPA: pyridoxal-dependent decarboxylase, partial [Thermoanaerobaculia bacterium]|nr:pyridoxal-dependent decarboxylase [Thermoanaerobaculia bacterium]